MGIEDALKDFKNADTSTLEKDKAEQRRKMAEALIKAWFSAEKLPADHFDKKDDAEKDELLDAAESVMERATALGLHPQTPPDQVKAAIIKMGNNLGVESPTFEKVKAAIDAQQSQDTGLGISSPSPTDVLKEPTPDKDDAAFRESYAKARTAGIPAQDIHGLGRNPGTVDVVTKKQERINAIKAQAVAKGLDPSKANSLDASTSRVPKIARRILATTEDLKPIDQLTPLKSDKPMVNKERRFDLYNKTEKQYKRVARGGNFSINTLKSQKEGEEPKRKVPFLGEWDIVIPGVIPIAKGLVSSVREIYKQLKGGGGEEKKK